jgi:hypothetical protein
VLVPTAVCPTRPISAIGPVSIVSVSPVAVVAVRTIAVPIVAVGTITVAVAIAGTDADAYPHTTPIPTSVGFGRSEAYAGYYED